jgi:hypothetical protein
MAVINESSYRFRRSNMVLMLIWYGNKKPPRGSFLNAALGEFEELGNSGIDYAGLRFFVKPDRPVFRNRLLFAYRYEININPMLFLFLFTLIYLLCVLDDKSRKEGARFSHLS